MLHLAEKQLQEEIGHLQAKVQALKQEAHQVENETEADLEKYNQLISEAKKIREEETSRRKENEENDVWLVNDLKLE